VSGGPIITLLTDFGTRDSYVAEVKGVLLTRAPSAVLVDVTHEIPPGDVLAAQYVLERTWPRFPAGTVHLAVVDPGVGSERRALAAAAEGHGFIAPDNGLLTPMLAGATVVALHEPADAAPTFHGRDLFAPAAAALALGTAIETLGPAVHDPVRRSPPKPAEREGAMIGHVVYVDRFGTLVTNLPGEAAARARVVWIGAHTLGPVRRSFSDVPAGTPLALVGSGGALEIAVRNGSAAATLAAQVGTEVRIPLTNP
jgi:S-adenosylmethionine hydrolase